jgi:hypothetical protein
VGSVVAAAAASMVICADEAAGAAAAVLAAMAAAAIARGAVAGPEAGVGVGVAVSTTATGMATATGFTVTGVDPFCCVEAAVPVEESLPELSLDDDLALDFPLSAFEGPDFEEADGGALALELELELAFEDCPLVAS